MTFYWMRPETDDPSFTPALARDERGETRRRVARSLRSTTPIADWEELELATEGSLSDFPLALEGTVCSDRLRALLDEHRGALDALEWLPCRIFVPESQPVRYWVLHFLDRSDSLDPSSTVFDSHGNPYRPVLDESKLRDRMIIPHPGRYGSTVYVRERIAAAIRAAGLEGIVLELQGIMPA